MNNTPARMPLTRGPLPPALTAMLLGLVSIGVDGQSVVNPDHVEITRNPAAVAYKKEIGRDASTWQWNIPLELPHVTHGMLHSTSMGRDVGYNIYLPPGYVVATQNRYPVVYYCHGASGSESSDVPVAEFVSSQIAKRNIGEVIYVFVNAGHFSGYRDQPENNVMAETYIIHELIPEIDRRYRTHATREGRALMGFSMGGGGATRLALKYPDKFCAVASFAGALDQDNASVESATAHPPDPDNIYHWATANQEKIKGKLGLYFFVGGKDRLYARQPPFIAHLHDLDIGFNYRVMVGLGHNLWGSMEQCGGEAIRFLAAHYAAASAPGDHAP